MIEVMEKLQGVEEGEEWVEEEVEEGVEEEEEVGQPSAKLK